MAKNDILMTINDVRIVEYDSLNVFVERYESYYLPTKKTYASDWRFKGYFATMYKALKGISTNEWLIDKNDVSDLESYLKQVQESNELLSQSIKTAHNVSI